MTDETAGAGELTQEEKDAILRLGAAIRTLPKTLSIRVYPEGLFLMKNGVWVDRMGGLDVPISSETHRWQPSPKIPRVEEEP